MNETSTVIEVNQLFCHLVASAFRNEGLYHLQYDASDIRFVATDLRVKRSVRSQFRGRIDHNIRHK